MENSASSFGHAGAVHEAVVRVPLIYVWPGRIAPGIHIQSAAQSVDLFPTLVDLLDLPRLSEFPGRSHAATLLGGAEPQRRRGEIGDVVQLQGKSKTWGVIATLDTGRFKLENYGSNDQPRIFRLDQDHMGKNDLSPAFEDERRILMQLHEDGLDPGAVQSTAKWMHESPAALPQQEIDELRALGYIEEAEHAQAELRSLNDQ